MSSSGRLTGKATFAPPSCRYSGFGAPDQAVRQRLLLAVELDESDAQDLPTRVATQSGLGTDDLGYLPRIPSPEDLVHRRSLFHLGQRKHCREKQKAGASPGHHLGIPTRRMTVAADLGRSDMLSGLVLAQVGKPVAYMVAIVLVALLGLSMLIRRFV